MKKILDKLNRNISTNKKMLIFFTTLTIIAVIAGSLFAIIIKADDKTLVSDYLKLFFQNIDQNNINYYETFINTSISNIVFVLIIWLLGFSVVGLPFTLFMYFSKSFSLGFSISSLIMNYKLKGLLYSIIYTIPSGILYLGGYTLLMLYSVSLSLKLFTSIIKKKSIDFKYIINKYLFILLISFILILIGILYETFIMPFLLNLVY